MVAINLHLRTVLKVSRCTLDMLSQILYEETLDYGKISKLSLNPPSWHIVALD
jgi:hypothetical protein